MDDKLLSALTALATKLGTTAEHLWGILVKQAPVTAISNIGFFSLILVLLLGWLSWWLILRKSDHWSDEALALYWVVNIILAITLFSMLVMGLIPTIAGLFNPEYWALLQVLKNLK